MKHRSFTLSWLGGITLLLSACSSPRVMTQVTKVYDTQVPADSVVLFEPGTPIPNSAEAIGLISVTDRGNSVNCNYDQVVRLAKNATGKVGGNGVAIIEHAKPSIWGSSCHQISGTMLRLTDWTVDTSAPNPVQEAITQNQEMVEQERARSRAPQHTLGFSMGCGWVTSNLYNPRGREITNKSGLDWKVSYEMVFKKGYGFGVLFSRFEGSFDEFKMDLTYFAPEFVGRIRFADHWMVKYALGCGLFIYDEGGLASLKRFGAHYELGLEYMVSKSIGIGLSSSVIAASMPSQERLKNNETSGIARINLLGGMRFYF